MSCGNVSFNGGYASAKEQGNQRAICISKLSFQSPRYTYVTSEIAA